MNTMKIAGVLLLAVAVAGLGGCASSTSGSAYTRTQTRQVQDVQLGVVESVRQVLIEGTKTPVGAIAGATLGGLAGNTMGGGYGKTATTILGAVAGGLAGSAIEENVTKTTGLEITVRLDNGRMIAVTQDADEAFRPGDQVRILSGGSVTRVTH